MSKTVLVTGASGGIGVDLAECFAKGGYDVIRDSRSTCWSTTREEARGSGLKVSCLCPGPTVSGFRERAGTGQTRLATLSKAAPSMPVAEAGYRGFLKNTPVVITGSRNRAMAELVRFVPRRTLLRIVKQIQSPAPAHET